MTVPIQDGIEAGVSGTDVNERQRLEDLAARAATIGFSLRPLPSGFALRRDCRLVHVISIESVLELLASEEARKTERAGNRRSQK